MAEIINLKLRSHHLFCARNFIGKGYSPEFVKKFTEILASLKAGENFIVVDGADDICSACPNLMSNGLCCDHIKIKKLDAKHSQLLSINAGDVLTWNQAQEKIDAKMAEINYYDLCFDCQWAIICQNSSKK